jgi:hypothetical protein
MQFTVFITILIELTTEASFNFKLFESVELA